MRWGRITQTRRSSNNGNQKVIMMMRREYEDEKNNESDMTVNDARGEAKVGQEIVLTSDCPALRGF